ncbi:hypothetical protein EXG27_18015, partial [Acinetobacter baumannii]
MKIISLKKPLQIGLCNKALARYNGNIMKKGDFFNFLIESYSKIEDESSNIFNNLNHLSEIGNKGFSSEKLFTEFQ